MDDDAGTQDPHQIDATEIKNFSGELKPLLPSSRQKDRASDRR